MLEPTVIVPDVGQVRRRFARRPLVLALVLIGALVVCVVSGLGGATPVYAVASLVVAAASLVQLATSRDRHASAPQRVEVADDQVTLWAEDGTGWRAVRSERSGLVLSAAGTLAPAEDRQLLPSRALDLHGFDLAVVGAALDAYGWSAPRIADRASAGEQSEVVELTPARTDRRRRATFAVGGVVAVAAIGIGTILTRATALDGALVPGGLVAFCVLALTVRAVDRQAGWSVIVTREEVQVARGEGPRWVLARDAVSEIRPGRWSAGVRAPGGYRLPSLPLRPRRREVVAALDRAGWPVSV